MVKIFTNSSKNTTNETYKNVTQELWELYDKKLQPLEKAYKFHEFHSPPLELADFESKPMVLLIGQYSTGKTTFINYLLNEKFPGMHIGPEPTTDRFMAIMHDERSGVIPGNALVVDSKKQYRPLSKFGNAFLNRFQSSHLPNSVLESVTMIDTPGILSGEKQRLDRGYDFAGVIEWFAERVDRIVLLFDAHKLDISDEFKRVIEVLKGNEEKIRIVLNKADMVDSQQLMRVYGALMWSLGKILYTPEVARVYIGTFWDKPLQFDTNRRLFELEENDLFQDLRLLPCNAALRKLNDLIRRARLAKVHAHIIATLKSEMPSLIGKETKKRELIARLPKIYEQIAAAQNISLGDFPKIERMQENLQHQDFSHFQSLNQRLIKVVDEMLSKDISQLMQMIPKEQLSGEPIYEPISKGGAFDSNDTPFGFSAGEGVNRGKYDSGWVVDKERDEADNAFTKLNPIEGKISGNSARDYMIKSRLPNAALRKIWILSDVDQDGCLDGDEFALTCYLIKLKLSGEELPTTLPPHLVPPSKRTSINGQEGEYEITNGTVLN